MIQRGLDTDATSYSDALERRLRFVSDMNVIANQVDVLLTPSTPSPALPDITNTGNTMFQGPWTYCGLPTVTLPSGLSDGGMPLGIQLIGQYLNESLLLSVSAWCESVMDVDLNPNL
jgi:Asp-tRNA(Asn)/Glu-tRNA(Gln) amidotransferase A subunit family amidase